jgi:outer membrane protein TolC
VTTLALATPSAFAAGGGMYDGPQEDVDPTKERQIPGQPLSLDQAIALGLRNNLNVEISRYAPYIAELDESGAWGAFDPLLVSGVRYNDQRLPPSNLFAPPEGALEDTIAGSVGLTALVPYLGATVGVTFNGSKLDTNSRFINFKPQYDTGLEFTADVPLMKGLLWNQAWTQVRTLKFASDQSRDEFETSVMDIVQGIISEYWNLVASAEQLRVAEKALETNKALLEQTQTQYDVGVVSKVEVVEAEAGVASSEFDRIVARNNYQNAQDQLVATLLGRRLTAATALTFSPTDNPAYEAVEYIDVEKAVATAFQLRPEIRAAQNGIEQAEIQQKFARNQRLPDLSFEFRHRTLGIDGDTPFIPAVPPDPGPPATPGTPAIPATSGDFGDALSQYYQGNKDWTVGGRFSIPIPNTRARKAYNKAEFELRRAESRRTQLKQKIIVDIRSAARGLIASAEGVEAAERRRLAAAEQLRAERIRLEHGESTPFDVLLRQNDLVEAESQKVTALRSFRDSQARLDRQTGVILQVNNVQIDAVRSLD